MIDLKNTYETTTSKIIYNYTEALTMYEALEAQNPGGWTDHIAYVKQKLSQMG